MVISWWETHLRSYLCLGALIVLIMNPQAWKVDVTSNLNTICVTFQNWIFLKLLSRVSTLHFEESYMFWIVLWLHNWMMETSTTALLLEKWNSYYSHFMQFTLLHANMEWVCAYGKEKIESAAWGVLGSHHSSKILTYEGSNGCQWYWHLVGHIA